MDIPLPFPHRLAAVARADYATIPRARCRRGDRSIYSVSVKHRGALCLGDKKLIWTTGSSVFVSPVPVDNCGQDLTLRIFSFWWSWGRRRQHFDLGFSGGMPATRLY
jgi:hypothetical protein